MVEENIKVGYKKTEIGIIPNCWNCIQLSSEYVNIFNGGTPSTSINKYWNGNIKWCTPTDITSCKGNYIYTTERSITEEGLKNSSAVLLPIGTLLLCSRATIGDIKISKVEITTNQGFKNIVTKEKLFNVFLYYYLLTQKNKMKEMSIGSTFLEISKKEVSNLYAPLPPFHEQKNIADVLNDIDTLLQSLEKLIDKKKEIKQGTMQQLLTGKKRLPGFSDEWEVKTLGSITAISKGQLITEKDSINGPIPVIAGGIKPSYYHIKANRLGKTITVSASGANAGYVGFHNQPIFASDCSTISERVEYSIEFVYYQLKLLQEKIYSLQTGGAQPHIHPKDLIPLVINYTCKSEQNAIVEVLLNMDLELEALEQKLEKYKRIKQGMMHELLTGRIRLI